MFERSSCDMNVSVYTWSPMCAVPQTGDSGSMFGRIISMKPSSLSSTKRSQENTATDVLCDEDWPGAGAVVNDTDWLGGGSFHVHLQSACTEETMSRVYSVVLRRLVSENTCGKLFMFFQKQSAKQRSKVPELSKKHQQSILLVRFLCW